MKCSIFLLFHSYNCLSLDTLSRIYIWLNGFFGIPSFGLFYCQFRFFLYALCLKSPGMIVFVLLDSKASQMSLGGLPRHVPTEDVWTSGKTTVSGRGDLFPCRDSLKAEFKEVFFIAPTFLGLLLTIYPYLVPRQKIIKETSSNGHSRKFLFILGIIGFIASMSSYIFRDHPFMQTPINVGVKPACIFCPPMPPIYEPLINILMMLISIITVFGWGLLLRPMIKLRNDKNLRSDLTTLKAC
jgi:hypothetical protein